MSFPDIDRCCPQHFRFKCFLRSPFLRHSPKTRPGFSKRSAMAHGHLWIFLELKDCRSNFCFSFTLFCTSGLYSASVARGATRVKNLIWPKSVNRSRHKPPLPQPGTTLPLLPNATLKTYTRCPMRQPTPSQRHVHRRPWFRPSSTSS